MSEHGKNASNTPDTLLHRVEQLRAAAEQDKREESDARAIEDSFDSSARRTITLSKYHRDPEPVLSADRWESKFRWRVVRVVETVET